LALNIDALEINRKVLLAFARFYQTYFGKEQIDYINAAKK